MVHPGLRRGAGALLALAVLCSSAADSTAGVVLADNLSETSGGAYSATGDSWLASSFGTDGSSYILQSVTLMLSRDSIGGEAAVDVYTDGGLEPGSLVATLAGPASVPGSSGPATFTASGVLLQANATYWVVLRAVTGEFLWSWAGSNDGSGAGFQTGSATSDFAGSGWFYADSYPFQMSVSASAVPEPGSAWLAAIGAAGVALAARRRRG
ncbi:MAG: hypothetical protein BGO49_17865 [Planctomycetales bacterium 71-10]|nr:MAG: hypothetical protein BGO49_17865 [Planctomycetales bacterium 71-10]